MKIRTKDGNWYVCELRGVVFISWVSRSDRDHAAKFPKDGIDKWVDLLSDMAGQPLEAVFDQAAMKGH